MQRYRVIPQTKRENYKGCIDMVFGIMESIIYHYPFFSQHYRWGFCIYSVRRPWDYVSRVHTATILYRKQTTGGCIFDIGIKLLH